MKAGKLKKVDLTNQFCAYFRTLSQTSNHLDRSINENHLVYIYLCLILTTGTKA